MMLLQCIIVRNFHQKTEPKNRTCESKHCLEIFPWENLGNRMNLAHQLYDTGPGIGRPLFINLRKQVTLNLELSALPEVAYTRRIWAGIFVNFK